MYKVNEFLGIKVVVFKDIDNNLSKSIYQVKNLKSEYYAKSKNGLFTVITEEEKVIQKLNNGEAVLHQGHIIFSEEKACNSYYLKFIQNYKKAYNQINDSDDYVKYLKDICGRPIVKAILIMYKNKTWTEEVCFQKLKNYFSDNDYLKELLTDNEKLDRILVS